MQKTLKTLERLITQLEKGDLPLEKSLELYEQGVKMVKDAEKDNGIEIEKLILDLKEHPDVINSEIKKLLEDGIAYEPRPGKLRYLG